MYKPKSPIAPSKINNLSPSPSNRRKNAIVKLTQNQNTSHRHKVNTYLHQAKMERKTVNSKQQRSMKAIQVDCNDLISSLQIHENPGNKETPKFCLKPELKMPVNNQIMSPKNFFSFGQNKLQEKREQEKESKYPKQAKKKTLLGHTYRNSGNSGLLHAKVL